MGSIRARSFFQGGEGFGWLGNSGLDKSSGGLDLLFSGFLGLLEHLAGDFTALLEHLVGRFTAFLDSIVKVLEGEHHTVTIKVNNAGENSNNTLVGSLLHFVFFLGLDSLLLLGSTESLPQSVPPFFNTRSVRSNSIFEGLLAAFDGRGGVLAGVSSFLLSVGSGPGVHVISTRDNSILGGEDVLGGVVVHLGGAGNGSILGGEDILGGVGDGLRSTSNQGLSSLELAHSNTINSFNNTFGAVLRNTRQTTKSRGSQTFNQDNRVGQGLVLGVFGRGIVIRNSVPPGGNSRIGAHSLKSGQANGLVGHRWDFVFWRFGKVHQRNRDSGLFVLTRCDGCC